MSEVKTHVDKKEILQAALNYSKMGWVVHPLKKGEKRPAIKAWEQRGQVSEKQLKQIFKKLGGGGLGILTGIKSGFIVIDIDKKSGGLETLEKLQQWGEPLEGCLDKTLWARTGGGGYHLLYKHPGAGYIIQNKAGVLKGVDVRGDGGQIVAPPSVHVETGVKYEWGKEPSVEAIGLLPPYFFDLIAEKPKPKKRLVKGMSKDTGGSLFEGDTIPEGQRNDTLYRLACSLRAKRLCEEAIISAVMAENEAKCNPPLSEREVKNIIQSALKHEPGTGNGAGGNGGVFEKHGKTWRKGEKKSVEVANFTAKIKTRFRNDNGEATWELALNGKEKVTLEILGKDIVSLQKFKEAMGNKGPFLYRISSGAGHCDYLAFLFEKGYKEIMRTQYLGRVAPDKFLFSNALVTPEGKKELTDLIPPISRMNYRPGGELRAAVRDFVEAYGVERAWKIFGFAVGTLFVNEISEHYGFYPLLFLYGKKSSGKSKLAELITWLFGAGNELKPFNFNSTAKASQRTLAKFKGVPVTLNEYQSNPTKNNRLILSIYDREGYHRAKTDNSLDTIAGAVEATAMVLSTQSPSGDESEAVLSRLIEIDMNYNKEAREAFNRLRKGRKELCGFVAHCMAKIEIGGLLELIEAAIEKNEAEGEITEQRIIENNSILQACSTVFFASLGLEEFIQTDIAGEIMEREKELSDTGIVKRFLTTLQNLGSQEGVVKKFAFTDITTGEYFFSLQNIYPEVRKYLRQAGLEIPDQRTMARALKDAGFKMKSKKFNGKNVKAWYISLKEITGEQE